MWLQALAALVAVCVPAMAGGPRWVSGPPYFWPDGIAIAWYTSSPLYFTDPGDLSASVNHAAADALVASAAAVWNVPTASLVLAQGGSLDEHVTGAMISVGGVGSPVLPADVRSANWQSKPIAIVYDSDGSVIDALLGAGGSDPSGCLQNGVVESVDLFGTGSTIEHALLILNGRCTGPDARQQTQLEYQLVRAFGRILGLGWSQTNDNVFTGSPAPTYQQALYWPMMHPIDIICGPYTFQCMPNPFTLRPDDLSAMAELYPIWPGQSATMPGKQDTLANASELDGWVYFPSGQGMEGVNVTVRRHKTASTYVEPWQTISAVSGFSFRRQTGTPIAGQDGSAMASIGTYEGWREGYWRMERVPIFDTDQLQTMIVTTEPVNPLYAGPYALSTMAAGSATFGPSGSAVQMETDLAGRYYQMRYALTASDAVASCAATADGTEGEPVAMPASGWWTGVLCGYGHSAWTRLALKLNHSFSVEVTALNESGAGSAVKAMPMIGLWQATDALGQGPTVASTPVAFNSGVTGMSTVRLSSAPTAQMRMVFTDQRGAGRPDFAYQARVLYADAIAPANVGAYGGTVVISGSGFRPGMVVTINGYAAVVTTSTATSLTVMAPSLRAIGSGQALLAPVTVTDPTTGGSTTILEGLGYGSPQERLELASSPTGTVVEGRVAAVPFAVRVLAADGVTPVAGEAVTLSFTAGSGTLGACGAASCTVQTDASGVASTTVTAATVGGVALRASTTLESVRASFTAIAAPDVLTLVSAPASPATVGTAAPVVFAVRLTAADGTTPRVGQTVAVSADNGTAQMTACGAASCSLQTDANGVASSPVLPLVAATIPLTASTAAGTVHASFSAAAARLVLVSAPAGLVTTTRLIATPFAVRVVGGDGVTPTAGAAVVFSGVGGGVSFAACGAATCTMMTNAQGMAASGVVAATAGSVTLSAAAASGSVSASFTAGKESMQAVSVPVGASPIGVIAGTPLTVRVLAPDGVTPVAGEPVSFHVTSGSALVGACGAATSCGVLTDAQGLASTTVTPESIGAITMVASSAGGTVSASLTGQALPDVLEVVSVPAQPVYTGALLSPGLVMRLVLADGTTPVPGQAMTFTLASGAASLGACGGVSCTVVTDGNGVAATTVTPALAGVVAIAVNVPSVAQATPQVVSFAVQARERTLVAVQPVQYVAEGVSASWTEQVAAGDNAGSTEDVAVMWGGGPGLQLGLGRTVVSGGLTTETVGIAGLGAGVRASGSACAWSTVCAGFAAEGVSATEWQIEAVSGAGQQGSASGVFGPVVLRVTDGLGHPVLGATVTVRQQVTAWQQACPDHGRCPGGTVLESSVATTVSDVNGLLTLAPLQLAGVAEVTEIAASAGTAGMATLLLEAQP